LTDSINEFQKAILDFCRHVAGPYKIKAICQSDDYNLEEPTSRLAVEVLIVLTNFQTKIMSYVRLIDGRNVVFFAVDQWVFERDIDRGFLGEALASLLIFPYSAFENQSYLHQQEILLKKRLITELLENLVLSYPELSYRLRVKPEYFMYEVMLNRIRIFPPMAYGTADFLSGKASLEKVQFVINGYLDALRQLAEDGTIIISEEYINISQKFIEANNNPKKRLNNTLKGAPRVFFTPIFSVFPQLLNFLSRNSQAFLRFQAPQWKQGFDASRKLQDPQKYVFLPTSQGYVSLADKMDIVGYVKSVLGAKYKTVQIEEFGGVLNDVYLIKANTEDQETKVLVKRFKNLSSMKWFPLSMWSRGVHNFALMGRSRLERESAINEALSGGGVNVPKILHVSASEQLIFMEFIEGENLGNAIKRIALAPKIEDAIKDLALVNQVGEIYAKVHALGVVLGDTKPENTMVDQLGRIFLLDFEQATRGGDKSWDIACFLYYCGHYLPINGEQKAQTVANAFISGYLKAGGNAPLIKAAAANKYTRIFSIFTLPNILRVISNICKNVEKITADKSFTS
jgi:tRNA A-37 threonylcarbamoyl transferase component Bud32